MTAPGTQQSPSDTSADHDTRDLVLAALAAWFASAAAIAALRLPARLVDRLVGLGYSRKAVLAAARYTMRPPLTGRTRYGSPGRLVDSTTARTVAVEEPGLRAQYLLNAAGRLAEADELDVFESALRREHTYLDGHLRAGRKRAAAATVLDRVAAEHGPWLIWRTQNDARVDPDCRKLAGTIFTVDQLPELDGRPVIPGAAHPFCRCYPEGLYSSSEPMPSIYAVEPVDLNLTATSEGERLDLAGWNPVLHPRIPKGEPGAGRFRESFGLPDREWLEQSWRGLSQRQRRGLRTYTGRMHDEINSGLRGERPLSKGAAFLVRMIDSAIEHNRPLSGPVTLRRATDPIEFGVHDAADLPQKVGGVFEQRSYYSTSLSWVRSKPVHLQVDVPPGVHALPAAYLEPVTQYPGQDEVLLERGLELMLTDAHRDDRTGLWHARVIVTDRRAR